MSRKCWIDCIGPIRAADSRWPGRLYLGALVLAWVAVLASGVLWWLKPPLLLMAVLVCRLEWRHRVSVSRLEFTPEYIRGRLCGGQTFIAEAPFQCMVTGALVSFRSDQGWLQLWADQVDGDTYRRLCRVLWLQRKAPT